MRHKSSAISPVRTRAAVLFLLVLLASLLLITQAAFASGPPSFEDELWDESVFSTRAHISAEFFTGQLETEWQSEYATSPGGPWTPSASGVVELNYFGVFPFEEFAYLGTVEGSANQNLGALIRNLQPATAYYARFQAKNEDGQATSPIFPFETKPLAKPEIGADVNGNSTFRVDATDPHGARASARFETNGSPTTYSFQYSLPEAGHAPSPESPSWQPFSAGGSGTISVAEDFTNANATLTGLAPETTYYVRARATNEIGTTTQTTYNPGGSPAETFTTPSAHPEVTFEVSTGIRNVTATSAYLTAGLLPRHSETHWRLEYSTDEVTGYLPVPGGEGTVTQAQAEALPEGFGAAGIEARLTGLDPATTYYVRLFAENTCAEGCGAATSNPASFETFGPPSATTFPVHGLHGESLRLLGSVNPNSLPTSEEQVIDIEGAPTAGTFTLSFEGQTTAPIPFDAQASAVEKALHSLPAIGDGAHVTGADGGPYTVFFKGKLAATDQPEILGDGSGLTPFSSVTLTTTQPGGEATQTHYHFDYISQADYEADGDAFGAGTESTPTLGPLTGRPDPADPSHSRAEYTGADLPALQPGETYRFRLSATNTSPGDPVLFGETQSLTVPAPPPLEPPAPCSNQGTRTGVSAALPDCRAYEQLTPVDKQGAQEIFHYGGNLGSEGALPGADGDHLTYGGTTVKWGSATTSGQSPYFFTRDPAAGWRLTAGTAQPDAGIFAYSPQVFSANYEGFAFESRYTTSPSSGSPHIEFGAGPPGGPYATLASVTPAQAGAGWVASSADFSKLVLQLAAHNLPGVGPTHTLHGEDLYEYSGGELRQLNVDAGGTVGSCGAVMPLTPSSGGGSNQAAENNAGHAVSADGSRVFFEAVPGGNCSESKHLYLREAGGAEDARTIELGAYRFIAADATGTRALLEKFDGEDRGLYLYEAGSAGPQFLPSSALAAFPSDQQVAGFLVVSADLSTAYILVHEHEIESEQSRSIYRYDIAAESLLFLTHLTSQDQRNSFSTSPDGRYFYFSAKALAGLPGGGPPLPTPHNTEPALGPTTQVYRYDSASQLLQCLSCASAFNSEPRLSALFADNRRHALAASADGDYVFFDTPAALLPADVDGEIGPELAHSSGGEHSSGFYSLSSDVYEWRRPGLEACDRPQGCLALITSGRGGFLNILLGTTASGRDVFFSTNESLLPGDRDTAGDIYDARIGGGFAEPSAGIQCEGDACHHPPSTPSEPTLSTSVPSGPGNERPRRHHKHHREHRKHQHKRAANHHRGGHR